MLYYTGPLCLGTFWFDFWNISEIDYSSPRKFVSAAHPPPLKRTGFLSSPPQCDLFSLFNVRIWGDSLRFARDHGCLFCSSTGILTFQWKGVEAGWPFYPLFPLLCTYGFLVIGPMKSIFKKCRPYHVLVTFILFLVFFHRKYYFDTTPQWLPNWNLLSFE